MLNSPAARHAAVIQGVWEVFLFLAHGDYVEILFQAQTGQIHTHPVDYVN